MPVHYWDKAYQEDIAVGVDPTTKRNPGGGSLAVTQVGRHTLAVGQAAATAAWPPAPPLTINNATKASVTVVVPGAALGDFAQGAFSLSLQGCQLTAEVSAADTVTVTISNLTGAPVIFSTGGTIRVLVDRSR